MNSKVSRPDYKVTALLPMKANSTRVKGKNFKEICGKPLFRWILDTLNKVDIIENIVINTDARRMLEKYNIYENTKVEIRDRPEWLKGDEVSMNKIISDDVKNYNSDIYLMTHSTNPLLSERTIKKAIDIFVNSDMHNSLLSVNKIQTRLYDDKFKAINHNPEILIPTQELRAIYEENSCLYIFTKKFSKKMNHE